ncbi:MAG TPA: DUF3570 domain-containing protein [Kofleriaceae bacterium]|jgi:hypothetical protein|nr:DUF3570 domain-containing protein [Kofleriaceae bacterium]
MRRLAAIALLLASSPAHADDNVDASTTWFQETRAGGQGGLTVIHPQLDLGIDLGDHFGLDAGWNADVVSGATAKVYSVDAVSSATTFDDLRNEGSLGMRFAGKRSRLGVRGGVAAERDYLSINFGGSGDIDLPGKNTNFALSYTHNMDQVCDRDNSMLTPFQRRTLDGLQPCDKRGGLRGKDTMGVTLWHDLSIDTLQGSVTQNLSPTMVGQVSLYGQISHGFQSNPYRAVRVRSVEAQETVPDVRARAALSVRVNKYLPALAASINADLRAYSDTWGVNSGTLEAAWNQYFGKSLLLRVRARLYQQSAAAFFKDAFFYETEGEAGAYFTGDRELGRIRNVTLGGKLTVLKVAQQGKNVLGLFDELRLNLRADLMFYSELPADDSSANPVGIDGQFLTSGRPFDGFILALGLVLRY